TPLPPRERPPRGVSPRAGDPRRAHGRGTSGLVGPLSRRTRQEENALQESAAPKALDDVRVLDMSTSFSGAWCSRFLADLGADVITIEPRAGHPLRALAPFAEDGTSIPAMYALANKRSLSVDVDSTRGRKLFVDLVRRSDVVVESTTPGTLG